MLADALALLVEDNGQILGCAVLGSEGGEIMTMIQIAVLGKLPRTAMADAIFAHPLLAEGLNSLRDVRRVTGCTGTGSCGCTSALIWVEFCVGLGEP